jgi:hypothetical protein
VGLTSLAGRRIGRVLFRLSLLGAMVSSCGLSAQGEGAVGAEDGGPSDTSSSGVNGGSSSGTLASSSGGSGSSSGIATYDDAADDAWAYDGSLDVSIPLSFDAGFPTDASPGDAGVSASVECSKLNTCCGILQVYGVAASTVSSCYTGAATNSLSTCMAVLSPLESYGLCP